MSHIVRSTAASPFSPVNDRDRAEATLTLICHERQKLVDALEQGRLETVLGAARGLSHLYELEPVLACVAFRAASRGEGNR